MQKQETNSFSSEDTDNHDQNKKFKVTQFNDDRDDIYKLKSADVTDFKIEGFSASLGSKNADLYETNRFNFI